MVPEGNTLNYGDTVQHKLKVPTCQKSAQSTQPPTRTPNLWQTDGHLATPYTVPHMHHVLLKRITVTDTYADIERGCK